MYAAGLQCVEFTTLGTKTQSIKRIKQLALTTSGSLKMGNERVHTAKAGLTS
jgi:hypothetical protein